MSEQTTLFGVPIEEAKVLRLQPGDVVVLQTPMKLTGSQRQNLRDYVRAGLGTNHRVMVLDGDLDIQIARREA